jgi:ABC-type transport system involved in multi-copper enzyme maturation permease subunit
MILASLVLEREPMRWADVPGAIVTWVQDAGIVAALALLIWALARLLRRPAGPAAGGRRRTFTVAALFAALGCLLLYGFFFVLLLVQGTASGRYTALQQTLLTAAGAIALTTAALPPLAALAFRLRWRRTWALARVTVKEAVRGRVLYVFALMAIIFLFAGYFVPYKQEDQIRNYVFVVFWPLSFVFLVLAALLGSFSIPRDVTKQTIHTIVTKPVERYEIVLGRFLGNGLLLTAGLFLLSALSLLYVARGVTADAAEESYKARVPVEPDRLTFFGTGKEDKGENVGREWDYRSFIRGRPAHAAALPRQYAVWWFDALPADFATRHEPIAFEFTFDIYRTSKAEKGKEGILCTLTFADGRFSVPQIEKHVRDAEEERRALQEKAFKGASTEQVIARRTEIDDRLIRKYGIYHVSGVPVVPYHTGKLSVPPVLFAKIAEGDKEEGARTSRGGEPPPAALKVLLSVGDDPNSSRQLVGVAKRDLYGVAGERPFWQNFLKGAAGLWLLVLLVLGVAVACSTYLSGIISLLCTFFLLGLGLVPDFLRELAQGNAPGGGPFQAAWRVLNRLPISAPLDPSPAASLGQGFDSAYSWLLRWIMRIIPDAQRFNLTEYVSSGFDISWTQVLLLDNLLPLLAYVVPWAILAYYLMQSREVANPS